MAHDIRAQLRFLSVSAQKVRLVVDVVRGKDVVKALETLRFMPQGAAVPVLKLLSSAVANAEENFGVSRDDLFVAKPILRRTSHVTVILRERETA
jgi:large subunit ribosomal protein L22